MTLDEAIRHAEEVAEEQEKLYKLCPVTDYGCKGDKHCNSMSYEYDGCLKCAEEHRQLAQWLGELKQLKEQEPCEDAISREELMKLQIHFFCNDNNKIEGYISTKDVLKLSSIKPQEPKTCTPGKILRRLYMQDKIVGWFVKIYKQGESCYLDDAEMIKREGAYPQSIRARMCFYSKQEAISFIGRCFRKVEDYDTFYGIEPYYYTDYRKDWGIPS